MVTGMGDFIRGIYYAMQFADKYDIGLDFYICQHPIQKYLEYFSNKKEISPSILEEIVFFDKANYVYNKNNNIINYQYINIDECVINHINSCKVYDGTVYVYITSHPDEQLIRDEYRKRVQNILKPCNHLNEQAENMLSDLNLQNKEFITIQIRTNDDCFKNSNNNFNKYIKIIVNKINEIYLKHKLNILVISSDNNIKLNLIKNVPYIKCYIDSICHLSYTNVDDISVMNTLKDFYVMSRSKYIYSFSVYGHGSGFSKWCAVTFNIPYICYSLPNV
jgi:hypothetical protein